MHRAHGNPQAAHGASAASAAEDPTAKILNALHAKETQLHGVLSKLRGETKAHEATQVKLAQAKAEAQQHKKTNDALQSTDSMMKARVKQLSDLCDTLRAQVDANEKDKDVLKAKLDAKTEEHAMDLMKFKAKLHAHANAMAITTEYMEKTQLFPNRQVTLDDITSAVPPATEASRKIKEAMASLEATVAKHEGTIVRLTNDLAVAQQARETEERKVNQLKTQLGKLPASSPESVSTASSEVSPPGPTDSSMATLVASLQKTIKVMDEDLKKQKSTVDRFDDYCDEVEAVMKRCPECSKFLDGLPVQETGGAGDGAGAGAGAGAASAAMHATMVA